MEPTEILSLAITLVSAVIFFLVGRAAQRRPATEKNRTALRLFATWWYGLAAVTILGAGETAAYRAGMQDVSTFLVLALVAIFLLCMALWGLLYYLLFLFTGKSWIITPLSIAYVGYFFFLVYFVLGSQPDGVILQNGSAQLHYAHQIGGPLLTALLLMLLLPQIIGSLVFFFGLYFIVPDREQRFRIGVVSWSIILWFGSSLIVSFVGNPQDERWQLVSQLIGLAAACAILIAYLPPKGLRRWFAAQPSPAATESQESKGPNQRVASVAPRASVRSGATQG